jgi:uncharacterized protein
MTRLEKLRRAVRDLYETKQPGRAEWCDWMYANHVFIVADNAARLARKYQANAELAEVAGMLHDIADIKMERADARHETESLKLARQVMQDTGYTDQEIALTVDDAIHWHSCHGDERPKSQEGLILATADSMAHLDTDFYVYAAWAFGKQGMSLPELKQWTLKKIDRDLNNKISFTDEREAARKSYGLIKELFSR